MRWEIDPSPFRDGTVRTHLIQSLIIVNGSDAGLKNVRENVCRPYGTPVLCRHPPRTHVRDVSPG